MKRATLQLLTRHKSIETTLKCYVDQDADDVADELRKARAGLGNIFGSSQPKTPSSRKCPRPTIDGSR